MRSFKNVIYRTANIIYWRCSVIGAIVIIGFLIWLLHSCYYEHKPESVLYGNWAILATPKTYSNNILTFDKNGEYYDSNTGSETWNYQFMEPDSFILYHHAFYEERYKILNLKEDTLIIKLSESIFHAEEMGKEIEANICDCQPIYTCVRLNHNTKPKY